MSNSAVPSWYDPSKDDGSPNKAPNAAEAIARQPQKFRDELEQDLKQPNTGTPYLTHALQKHLPSLLLTDGVAVPDDPEEMRWRLFFAHSQDMLGFRADIFTGGLNEENNPYSPDYKGLRDRWPDGRSMLQGLAALWLDNEARSVLTEMTNPFRPVESRRLGIQPLMDLLRGPHGNEATRVFADTFDELKGHKIAHKTNAIIRAYCQNAAALAPHDYCFRTYLRSIVPDLVFPSDDFTESESQWRTRITQDFYHVGPALAPYLIADWLFWFWREGQISWFDSYKADSVWLKTLANGTQTREAVLPPEAVVTSGAFYDYCKQLRLPPEWIPAHLWHIAFYGLPPRLVNEVIWLEEAATGEQLKAALGEQKIIAISADIPEGTGPSTQTFTGWPKPPPLPEERGDESAFPDTTGSETIHNNRAVTELKEMQVISPVTYSTVDKTNDGKPLAFPMSLVMENQRYYVGFTSEEMLGDTIDPKEIALHESSLAALCRIYLDFGSENGIDGVVLDPFSPAQRYLTHREITQIATEPHHHIQAETTTEAINVGNILHMMPLSRVTSPAPLSVLRRVLSSANFAEAWGVCITYTDLRQTWMIALPTDNRQIFADVWQSIWEGLSQLIGSTGAMPDVALCDSRTSQFAKDFGEALLP